MTVNLIKEQTRRKGRKYFKTAALLLVLLCLSGSTIAWSFPANPAGHESASPLFDESVPVPSNFIVSTIVADKAMYSQTLHIWMTVINTSDMPARNVRLFYRATPEGVFVINVVDQPYIERDADNVAVCLDTLPPFEHKEVNFFVQVPGQDRIKGEWSHNFHFDFHVVADGVPESHAGTITLSTRQGKILVIKSGFSE